MRLITLLNHCHHFPGFVYEKAPACPERGIIEIDVATMLRRKAGVLGLSLSPPPAMIIWPAPLRNSSRSGVSWCCYFTACAGSIAGLRGAGRRTAGRSASTSDQGLHAVSRPLGAQAVVAGNRRGVPHQLGQSLPGGGIRAAWGLEHRHLGPIQAIGVDEIQYAKGHKYLTPVYQIEQAAPGCCGSARTAPWRVSSSSST
jgi:hypothetical protein